MLLVLSFGKFLLPSNDSVRGYRAAGCSEVYKRPPNETPEKKKERKTLKMLCKYAALGHPNRKGAVLYADTITTVLKPRFLSEMKTLKTSSLNPEVMALY